MEFRPCIDIHNGKVKQIVGGSLKDEGNMADENFVSGQDAVFYANLYKKEGFRGGHIILLNARDSEYYEATKKQAVSALQAYPGGLQVGGGGSIFTFEIKGDDKKAQEFIDHLQLFSLLANVADVKSLVIHPASTTHAELNEEEQAEQGIKPNTIRLSIGTENIDDILYDLQEEFDAVK